MSLPVFSCLPHSSPGGIRTRNHKTLVLAALPISIPGHTVRLLSVEFGL